MATINEEPQYNELRNPTHIQQHNTQTEADKKDESDCDKELFESQINNPIILQNKLNNIAVEQVLTKTQSEKNRNEINQSGNNFEMNGTTTSTEESQKIQRSSDIIIQDITNQPEENSQEISQKFEDSADIQRIDEIKNNEKQNTPKVEIPQKQNEKDENIKVQKGNQKPPAQDQKLNEQAFEEKQKFAQIFAIGNQIKEEARKKVQSKNYRDAIKLYEECLQVIDISNFKLGEDKKKYFNIIREQVELALMVLCNLSLCFFNIEEYEISLQYGEKIFLIDPNHLKGTYRRAVALKKLQRYEKAYEEIKNARLIAIGKQQVDENINKEYNVIKQLYSEHKQSSKNNSGALYNTSSKSNDSSGSFKNKSAKTRLSNSSMSNVADFLDNNFPRSMKTTPFYALCSAFTSYVVLRRFMNIDVVTKPFIIGCPILSLSIFGFLQGKNAYIKLLCGGLIGIISSILSRFADFANPYKAITF